MHATSRCLHRNCAFPLAVFGASHSLGSIVGVGLVVFGVVRLLHPAPPEVPLPTDAELEAAEGII